MRVIGKFKVVAKCEKAVDPRAVLGRADELQILGSARCGLGGDGAGQFIGAAFLSIIKLEVAGATEGSDRVAIPPLPQALLGEVEQRFGIIRSLSLQPADRRPDWKPGEHVCPAIVGEESKRRPARITENRRRILAGGKTDQGVGLSVDDRQRDFPLGLSNRSIGVSVRFALKDH